MADKTLVLAVFENEPAADTAAQALKDSGTAHKDAVGILVLDAQGELKEDKVGARSTGKGAGIGALLFVLGPAALGVGVVGGAAVGALHHKGLGLDEAAHDRLVKELKGGRAAVGVLAHLDQAPAISAKLTDLGGAAESHTVSDQALEQATAGEPNV